MSTSPGPRAARVPFDACYPAHLKFLLRDLGQALNSDSHEDFSSATRRVFDFLLRYWTGAALGALDRLHSLGQHPLPDRTDWCETLKLLRYAVMAWEGHPQSSFRTLLRLGYFESGDPPRPRLHCRWLGVAGEWSGEAPSADQVTFWQGDDVLPGEPGVYLEILSEWLRASRALFVKLLRRYSADTPESIQITLEDGRGKQLPLLPAIALETFLPSQTLDLLEAAEKASSPEQLPELTDSALPSGPSESWLEESLDDILGSNSGLDSRLPEAVEPSPPLQPALTASRPPTSPPAALESDGLDALLGLGSQSNRPLSARNRPRPLEFPATLPAGVRSEMELARKAILHFGNQSEEDDTVRQELARGLVKGLSCLLELTARVACAGLAQVGPLPDPLRVALQQPVPAGQSVKLLHFAWTALHDYPNLIATSLLQSLFFELSAPEVPRQHARWLGLPDEPLIGLQHVTYWTRLAEGQIRSPQSEFQVQLREALDAIQLWLVAGSPLWAACDPELSIRPDGHWSGTITLGGEKFQLDPDGRAEQPLEVLLEGWRESCARQRPPFFVLDEVQEFVESVSPGSGLLVQGPKGVGKSFLIHDLLQRQPQLGGHRCGWIRVDSRSNFALEQLNYDLQRLQEGGFPLWPLGPAALADIVRHSPKDQLFGHYFAALQERNQHLGEEQSSLRVILLEEDVPEVEALIWCHLVLPKPFVWVATCSQELPGAWAVPCPPARLPISADELAFQKLQLDFWQEILDWSKPQILELLRRSGGDFSVQKLWAGALESELVTSWKELPEAEQSAVQVLSKVLEDRKARPALLLLTLDREGLPLAEFSEGQWAGALGQLLQYYSWMVMERPSGHICLRQWDWAETIRQLVGPDRDEAAGQYCQYLLVKLATQGSLQLEMRDLLRWLSLARSQEAAWSALQSSSLRSWKEEQVHLLDGSGQAHRKVELVTLWLQVLELALQWGREKTPLQLHEVLEEQLWSYSSRGLTYRGLGRLHEALLDVEQAIAGFRPLVEQRPELINGLAAALNRRSEILRELGRHAQALQDADQAIEIYSSISDRDPTRCAPLLALTVHHRSLLHQDTGRLEEAEADLRRALDLYQPHRESLRPRMRLDLVRAYLSRAQLASRRGDGLLARDDSLRCLELLQRFQENWIELRVLGAQAQTRLAEAHRLLEDEGKALAASDQAIHLWQQLIDEGRTDLRGAYAEELCRRGELLYRVGRLEDALQAAQPGSETLLQLVEAEGRSDLSVSLSQSLLLRGRIWQRRGRAESARRDLALAFHYLSSLSHNWDEQPNNPAVDLLVDTVVLLSQLHLNLGQRGQAVDQLKAGIHWSSQGTEPTHLENRALLESLLGRAEEAGPEALGAHQRALELYNELVDEQGQYQLLPRLAEAHLGRARTFRQLGEEELALADANQAVELVTFLSEKGGDPEMLRLLPAARFEVGEILGLLGQKERALEHLEGGLQDLELLEPDLARVEFLLEKARGGSLQALLLEDEAAAEQLAQVLELLEEAGREGAEVRHLEADARRLRAEILLRSGRTAEAVDELLGSSRQGSSASEVLQGEERQAQIRELLQGMLLQALDEAAGDPAQRFESLLQVGELLCQGEAPESVTVPLTGAYREKARACRKQGKLTLALEAVERGLELAVVLDPYHYQDQPYLVLDLLEERAHLARELKDGRLLASDTGRVLDWMSRLRLVAPERTLRMLAMRVAEFPEDPSSWTDMEQMAALLRVQPEEGEWLVERARLLLARVRWLFAKNLKARAISLLESEREGFEQAYPLHPPELLVDPILQMRLWKHRLQPSAQTLTDWAMWLGENLEAHPQLAEGLSLESLWNWLKGEATSPEEVEGFARVWLAILADNPRLPEVCFEPVPWFVPRLQVMAEDSSCWASLIDILDKQVQNLDSSRLTWEGESIQALLHIPRDQVSQNPDLEMALADCMRRWSELPPHRLAMAGVSAEALGEWLMS